MRTTGYVVVLVFVGALAAATPWVDGYHFKQNYSDLLASLSSDSSGKIKIVEYSQGWLSSDATLSIDLNPPNAKTPDPAYIITVNQHITHGPFVKSWFTDRWVFQEALLHSQLHIDKKTESMIIGSGTEGIAQVDTLVSFNGHYENMVQTPVFTVKISDTGKLTWQGVSGFVHANFANNKLSSINSEIALGELAVQDKTGNLSIDKMGVVAERHCQQAVLCSGTSNFVMQNASGLIDNVDMKMVGTTIKSTYGADANNVYSANLDMAMEKLTMPDYTVGPVAIKFAMNNVNAESLKKLLDISKTAGEASGADRQSAAMLLLAEYNKELPHLILANSVINQDMKVDTSYGNFTSVAKFYWPAGTPLPQSSQDFIKMNFKVDMHAATTLVNKIVSAIDEKREGVKDTNAVPAKVDAPAPAAVAVAAAATPAPVAAPAPAPVAAPPVDHIKAILDPYVGAGPHKIPPDVITALTVLKKQHLSPAIYNASVDKIIMVQHLPRPLLTGIASQLKDLYATSYSESETGAEAVAEAPAPAPVPAAAPPVVASVATPAPAAAPAPAESAGAGGQLKQQLDAMIKQGFIKQDKDDYVVSLVYDGATMQVNGVTIPLPMPTPATAQ